MATSSDDEERPAKKSKTTESRAKLEKERRQQIRTRILDLRDVLPYFQNYLSKSPATEHLKLVREMTMLQILDVTVSLLEELAKDERFMRAEGRSHGVPAVTRGSYRHLPQFNPEYIPAERGGGGQAQDKSLSNNNSQSEDKT